MENAETARIDRDVVIARHVRHAPHLGDPQAPPVGPIEGLDLLELDHAVNHAAHDRLLFRLEIGQKRRAALASQVLLQELDLVAKPPPLAGEQAELRQGVDGQPLGADLIDHRHELLHRARQLDLHGVDHGLDRALRGHSGQEVVAELHAREVPGMRAPDLLQLGLGLGGADIERPLALPRAFEQELQRERRLARSARPRDEIDVGAGQTAPEGMVEARHTGRSAVSNVLAHLRLPPQPKLGVFFSASARLTWKGPLVPSRFVRAAKVAIIAADRIAAERSNALPEGHELAELLRAAGAPAWMEAAGRVHKVEHDSRRVGPGDLFIAVPGLTVDGHDYADRAAAAGALAVVGERPLVLERAGARVPFFQVEDSTRALGLISSALHAHPSRELVLAGVTGTNGKSTTAYLLREMIRAAGAPCGLVGTITFHDGALQVPAPYTTPTAPELQAWLGRMVANGCSHAVMEVSSHGLQLGRLWGCELEVGAFSNLTQDHLDLHGDMARYLEAKLLLFKRHLRRSGTAVVNLDGAQAEAVVACARAAGLRLLCCSQDRPDADVRLERVRHGLDGIAAELVIGGARTPIRSALVGAFNADNLLLAASCGHALGLAASTLVEGARRLEGVPGRLERVVTAAGAAVFVDYAHTPDALARVLEVLRPLCRGRLVVLFGCGGDRDRGKRPLMGRAAACRADVVVITSDNPRSEDPQAILEAIEPAVAAELPRIDGPVSRAERGYRVISERGEAIAWAIEGLRAEDVLLIAGKGHEDYQIVGSQRRPFDDREAARAALVQWEARRA